ncbi:unnamed protein product [Somion occarium]|uniref:FAD dependent oxidoreductase domain-containing protein n=1 Tax=Somion occarium TaxID=3059160 RepID=A0ABP1DS97_9APHY
MSTSSGERNIVIIGAGIIGCTAAYYISHHPSFSSNTRVTIIEASKRGVAQGASGKAGGLVAAWAYPEELVSISFPEHERLAEMYDGANRWGFRYVNCGSWEGRGEVPRPRVNGRRRSVDAELGPDWEMRKRVQRGLPADLDWVKEELTDSYSVMAPAGQTAQVHPYLFTTSMFKFAKEKGVEFIAGKATSLNIDPSSKSVTGVTYIDNESQTEKTIPATQIILAAGVWSPKLIPSLPISGTRAHSITLRFNPPKVFAPHVLFTEITMPIIPSLTSPSSPYSPPSNTVRVASPEIYPRPTNEVYVCGPGDNPPIPETVDDVIVEPRLCENAREQVASISNELREGTIARRQACFLPVVTKGGGPIIGEAETIAKGLIIATGHTCWGISNAPGTGKLLAELVMDGEITSADLKKLAPSKFI